MNSTIQSLEPHVLASWMKLESKIEVGIKTSTNHPLPSFLVIDVRDSDYDAKKIRNSIHVPWIDFDINFENIIYHLQKYPSISKIVFHCTFSAVRGPSAASLFVEKLKSRHLQQQQQRMVSSLESSLDVSSSLTQRNLKIYVLKGGFSLWNELYGSREDLTEPIPFCSNGVNDD